MGRKLKQGAYSKSTTKYEKYQNAMWALQRKRITCFKMTPDEKNKSFCIFPVQPKAIQSTLLPELIDRLLQNAAKNVVSWIITAQIIRRQSEISR